jgi:transcriptional regulator with XRE-family HTH domain
MDIMISFVFKAPCEISFDIAKNSREKRLSLNMSQQSLAERSGVSYGVIKKFEQKGKISLESLLKIALVLDSLDGFSQLFLSKAPEKFNSLDELLKDNTRKRGRK